MKNDEAETNAGGGDRPAVSDRTASILRAKNVAKPSAVWSVAHDVSRSRPSAAATTSATVTTVSDFHPSAVAASKPPSSGRGGRTDDESPGSTVDGRWRCPFFRTGQGQKWNQMVKDALETTGLSPRSQFYSRPYKAHIFLARCRLFLFLYVFY